MGRVTRPWPLLVVVLVLFGRANGAAGGVPTSMQWVELKPTGPRPSERYSHSMVELGNGELQVLTHGYYFDHKTRIPMWLNDTWVFDNQVGRWDKITQPGPLPENEMESLKKEAQLALSEKRLPRPVELSSPVARYKLTLAYWRGSAYLFGGDDGGHLHSETHVWGSHFNDIWQLSWEDSVWFRLETASASPPPRQGHTAVTLRDEMVVFGGVGSTQLSTKDGTSLVDLADVWIYHFRQRKWADVTARSAKQSNSTPIARRGHCATPLNQRMVVFGGFTKGGNNLNDLWMFDGILHRWTQIHAVDERTEVPSPRGSAACASDNVQGVMFLFGGAHCKGACTTHDDLWMYSLKSNRWDQLNQKGPKPTNRFQHAMTYSIVTGSLFVTGGESYKPYKYFDDLWKADVRDIVTAAGKRGFLSSSRVLFVDEQEKLQRVSARFGYVLGRAGNGKPKMPKKLRVSMVIALCFAVILVIWYRDRVEQLYFRLTGRHFKF